MAFKVTSEGYQPDIYYLKTSDALRHLVFQAYAFGG